MIGSGPSNQLARPRRAFFLPQFSHGAESVNALEKSLILGGLIVLMLLNIALIGFKVGGVPVRAGLAALFLGLLTLQYPAAFTSALRRHQTLIGLAVLLAVLGAFVSALNNTSVSVIITAIIEVHLQIVMTLLLATMVAILCGARTALLAIAATIGLSMLVAVFQFLDVGWAWNLRETLGRIQGQNMAEVKYFLKGRPMGLSFSPIHLATQICIAFAAVAITRMKPAQKGRTDNLIDIAVLAALLLLVAGSVISGNRSPILGAGIFFVIFASMRGGSPLPIILGALALLAYFIAPMIVESMQASSMRIAQSGDRSAASRVPLAMLGWKLFLENPLGYGFGFESAAHWSRFWHEIYTLQSADVIRDKALHNYPLSMLNTYGVGLLLALPLAAVLIYRARRYLVYFIPYVVHIMFHNSGPFWNDTVIWFVIGAAAAMGTDKATSGMMSAMAKPSRRLHQPGRGIPQRSLLIRAGRKRLR